MGRYEIFPALPATCTLIRAGGPGVRFSTFRSLSNPATKHYFSNGSRVYLAVTTQKKYLDSLFKHLGVETES